MSDKAGAEVREALELYGDWVDREATNRQIELEDLKFCEDPQTQWPDNLRRLRETDPWGSRPCLVVNKVKQFVTQVTNDQRQNRPSIKIRAASDDSHEDVAEVLSGLCRHTEQISDADIAYDTGCFYQTVIGRGYWRIVTDYSNDEAFDQEAFIRRIDNPFSVYMDPDGLDPAGADQTRTFITDEIPIEQFKRDYPKAHIDNWESTDDTARANMWFSKEFVRIAEYFCVHEKPEKLVLLDTGATMWADEWQRVYAEATQRPQVVRDRMSARRRVVWQKLTGSQVLDEKPFPGSLIPVVRVVGNEVNIQGRKTYYGLVRNAKDAQRMYNYWLSTETEKVALDSKAPWVGAAGSFDGFEDRWQLANQRNYSYLEYNGRDAEGNPIPPPQRQPFAGSPVGVVSAKLAASDDIKASMGMYDANLGNREGQQSGRAIMALNRQGDNATFHYQDNLGRAIRYTGRILLGIYPEIYDTPRVARTIGLDGAQDKAQLDPSQPDAVAELKEADGAINKIYNIGVGSYDVAVTVGPSYATKRLEAAESMAQLLQGNPELWQAAGDILVRNMDWPGSEELAERLERMVPAQLKEPEDEQQAIPPQVQQTMQQMDGVIQQLQQENEQLKEAANKVNVDRQRADTAQYDAETRRAVAAHDVLVTPAPDDDARLRATVEAVMMEILTQAGQPASEEMQ